MRPTLAWRLSALSTLALCAHTALAAVNVNTATTAELMAVDGMTEELANSIIREREENGQFNAADDLKRVPGMTPDLLTRLKGQVSTAALVGGGGKPKQVDQEVSRILKKFEREPSIRATQEAAIDHARANPGLIDSWRIRSRLRGWAPQVRVSADYLGSRDYLWPTVVGAETYLLPGAAVPRRDTLDNRVTSGATLTWNLDRAIFDPEEPRVNREAVRLAKHMDQVVDDVTRRYFERRRLQVEMELNPPTDVNDRLRRELRLQELTADLDGLTGGYFSRQLGKGRGK